jgi:hypothetical protein
MYGFFFWRSGGSRFREGTWMWDGAIDQTEGGWCYMQEKDPRSKQNKNTMHPGEVHEESGLLIGEGRGGQGTFPGQKGTVMGSTSWDGGTVFPRQGRQ